MICLLSGFVHTTGPGFIAWRSRRSAMAPCVKGPCRAGRTLRRGLTDHFFGRSCASRVMHRVDDDWALARGPIGSPS
jgi:hypothetical protein